MPDNAPITPGSGRNVATDEVSYSGDTADVQLVRPVMVTGAEGSKTVVDLPGDATNGLRTSSAATTVPTSTTMQSAATANGNGTSLNVNGYSVAVLNVVASPAMSGGTTINFEASVDDTTWVAINAHTVGTNTIGITTTANGDYRLSVAGYKSVRARISGYSAGTITVKGYASVAPGLPTTVAVSGTVPVTDNGGSLTVDNAGTFAVQAAGDVAHGSANSGNPVQSGAEAIAHGTNPTATAAGNRTKLYANRAGVPFVMGGHPNVQTIRLQFTAAQTDVAIVTVGAGSKIVVTALQVTLDNASTVFPSVRIGFGTANTPTTTGVIAAHGGVPAGGGFSRGDGSGILGVGADGEDLRITTVGVATGNGVEVVVTYYTIES